MLYFHCYLVQEILLLSFVLFFPFDISFFFLVWEGSGEEGSGWGTRVYLWWIHVDIWQHQYNIVKLNNKTK